ncbi:phage tail protein [Caenimonas aquaedulcis]|uniref:Phage tail protein n=1 Tax=Caenimonas aquaedulcis TaxID=2793270 RepID=A0A931H4E7_9BURK|nr:tail fiber protein [Caenimonas aquaedulcis]MBG9388416.1 phage tail protein [Caenimonas aquaedulcis]
MADPFISEIRIFPFNYAPQGWAWCDGQMLPPSQNTALFALIGTTYGGDGKSTFALPNLQGKVPMHAGQGPGLSQHPLGESGGSETVTLLQSEMPVHSHGLNASVRAADNLNPGTLSPGSGNNIFAPEPGATVVAAAPQALALTGGGQAHNNMQPYLTLYFCIALQGVFPPRS